MLTGWKTKTGLIVGVLGTGLLAGAEVAPTPQIGVWCRFLGMIMAGIGTGLAGYGIAHKVERQTPAPQAKEPPTILGNSGQVSVKAMDAILALVVLAMVWSLAIFKG